MIERRAGRDGKIGAARMLYPMDWARQEKLSILTISLYRKVGFKPKDSGIAGSR
jgi:hypothetical protein